MRALFTRIFVVSAYEAFFSGSKGHFNIGSCGPAYPFYSFTGTMASFYAESLNILINSVNFNQKYENILNF